MLMLHSFWTWPRCPSVLRSKARTCWSVPRPPWWWSTTSPPSTSCHSSRSEAGGRPSCTGPCPSWICPSWTSGTDQFCRFLLWHFQYQEMHLTGGLLLSVVSVQAVRNIILVVNSQIILRRVTWAESRENIWSLGACRDHLPISCNNHYHCRDVSVSLGKNNCFESQM